MIHRIGMTRGFNTELRNIRQNMILIQCIGSFLTTRQWLSVVNVVVQIRRKCDDMFRI